MSRKLSTGLMLPCPKGVSRSYQAGWKARLAGKRNTDCGIKIPHEGYWDHVHDWIATNPNYWPAIYRKQAWHSGYLACSRAIGRIRKAERFAQETKDITAEHDWLAELAEEFAA